MARLTKEDRDALPADMFAVPEKRKLPLRDEDHVRLGWDMVDQTKGLTPEERREARERLKRRGTELGMDVSDWKLSASFSFEAMALSMPDVDDHPNRMPFKGVLTRVDQFSDAPPGGANGKRTYLPSGVAEAALGSLLGMAVDFTPNFDGHDSKRKIGLITGAEVVGDAVQIEGYFYAKDFPQETQRIRAEKGALGFSFEADARIQDVDAEDLVIVQCVFTGAAVLYKDKAAYTTTSLAAQAAKDIEMTKEEMQALLASAIQPLADGLSAVNTKIAEIEAKGASLSGPVVDQIKPHVDMLNAAADNMEKAGVGTDPKAGHVGVLRRMAAHLAAGAVSGQVPMVYRDHDYLPDARVEASAAVKKEMEEKDKQIATLSAGMEDLKTQVIDLKAQAFKNADQPERQTIPGNVKTLLAKAGITDEQVVDGKLSVAQVDATLKAAGIKGVAAIEHKLKLRAAGLMPAGSAE